MKLLAAALLFATACSSGTADFESASNDQRARGFGAGAGFDVLEATAWASHYPGQHLASCPRVTTSGAHTVITGEGDCPVTGESWAGTVEIDHTTAADTIRFDQFAYHDLARPQYDVAYDGTVTTTTRDGALVATDSDLLVTFRGIAVRSTGHIDGSFEHGVEVDGLSIDEDGVGTADVAGGWDDDGGQVTLHGADDLRFEVTAVGVCFDYTLGDHRGNVCDYASAPPSTSDS